jgi:hypothetical protein
MFEVARSVGRFAWWHGYAPWAHPLADRLASRWGLASRLIRWPIASLAPCHQNELHLMRALGLGDVLMCTPALRELKQRSPTCRVTCYTELTSLVSGLPFIDDVRPMVELPETFIRNVATRS